MKTLIVAAIRCGLLLLVPSVTYAISAEWDLDPISGDWNTAANWTPNGVPNGPADIATFGLSHTTDVSISANTEVNSIIFTSAATNSYSVSTTVDVTLTISGAGIINNSGTTHNFVTMGGQGVTVSPGIIFTNMRPPDVIRSSPTTTAQTTFMAGATRPSSIPPLRAVRHLSITAG
jgi:hypothetical protein